jgi:serine/threonine protein kinase
MKICPACNLSYADGSEVCAACGARLVMDTSAAGPDPGRYLTGRVIGGNYRVERMLGQGGMGAVFEAVQLSLNRKVAVKVLLAPLAMNREAIERFRREAMTASNIGHPGITQVIDLGYLQEGPPFIVMELLEGEDMRSRLQREKAFGLDLAVPVMIQVCDVLQAAHDKGIVHRDLKPDNIFLVPRRQKVPMVKILDFGLSKIRTGGPGLTGTGTLLGTPNYMSPEQVRGEKDVDHRSDIYAAGVILYEILTGCMAYDGPSIQSILVRIITGPPRPPRTLRPDMPPQVEAVIMRAMEMDPSRRFQSMLEMGGELTRAARAAGVPSSTVSVMTMAAPPATAPAFVPPAVASGQPTLPYAPAPPTPGGVSATSMAAPAATTLSRRKGRRLTAGLIAGLVVILGSAAALVAGYSLHNSKKSKDKVQQITQSVASVDAVATPDVEAVSAKAAAGQAAAFPGSSLGRGLNPHLCCGKASCALVYQEGEDDEARIYLRVLGSDLSPAKDPLAVTMQDEAGAWPTCFARREGGFLVVYQEVRKKKGSFPVLRMHRAVVSGEGVLLGNKSSDVRNNVAGAYMGQAAYSAAASGGSVFVVHNYFFNIKAVITLSVYDMNGKEEIEDLTVSDVISADPPTIGCGPSSCLIAWTKPSPGLTMTEKISVVSLSGKVIAKEIDAFDKGLLNARRAFLPVAGGAMLLWVEEAPKSKPVQMMAKFGWDGKLLIQPRAVAGFGDMDPLGDHASFAAASPDGKSVLIAHPAEDRSGDLHHVVALIIDEEGKETGGPAVIPPDMEEDMDAAAFYTPQGLPVVISQVEESIGPDLDLRAVPFKPK